MTSEDTKDAGGHDTRGFPGGSTSLPRLSRPRTTDPSVIFVESAFFREPRNATPSATTVEDTGFGRYYSTESLFDPPAPRCDDAGHGAAAYAVLGLTRENSWEEISKSHRRLVSELHPDRYVDADEVVRNAAERRVRDVNEAYAEIRRERAAGQGL